MDTDFGYTALDVAKWFINATDREAGDDITHLKVQKLVYYAQGWALASFSKALFREDMEAWAHGPVAPSVWEQFKDCGWSSLPVQKLTRRISPPHMSLLSAVNEKYGIFSAKKLEAMTHNEMPWIRARGNLSLHARCTNSIKQSDMKAFFEGQKVAA